MAGVRRARHRWAREPRGVWFQAAGHARLRRPQLPDRAQLQTNRRRSGWPVEEVTSSPAV